MISRLLNESAVEITAQDSHTWKVERVLRWFEKEGNELVGETILKDVKVEHLQDLFGIVRDNPMYDCYPLVTLEQFEYFKRVFDLEIEPLCYDYFLECDTVAENLD